MRVVGRSDECTLAMPILAAADGEGPGEFYLVKYSFALCVEPSTDQLLTFDYV